MIFGHRQLWILFWIHFYFIAQGAEYVCFTGQFTKRSQIETNGIKICEMWVTVDSRGVEKKSIWHAHHEKDFCEKKQKAYISRLEQEGWKCEEQNETVSQKEPISQAEMIRALSFFPDEDAKKQIETSLSTRSGPSSINLTGSFTTGVDSNVLLLPDTAYGVWAASPFISPAAQMGIASSLIGSPISAHLSASYSSNLNTLARPYNNLPLRAGFEWQIPGTLGEKYHFSIQEEVSAVWLHPSDLNLFSVSQHFALKKMFPLDTGHQITVMAFSGYQSFPGVSVAPVNIRDGFSAGGTFINQHTADFVTFSESLTYTHQFARGNNFKSDLLSLFGSAGIDLSNKVFGSFFTGLTYVNFPISEYGRTDTRFSVGAQLTRPIESLDSVMASLGVSHEDSISTQVAAQYQKNLAFLRFTYAFN